MENSSHECSAEEDHTEGEEIPSKTELEYALINYILTSDHIFFLHNPNVWTNFHSSNLQNYCEYSDYTPEKLCSYFLRKVLPRIYNFELKIEQKTLLRLLELHPKFNKSNEGFKIIKLPEEIIEYADFTTETPQLCFQDVDEFSLEPGASDVSHSVVALRNTHRTCKNKSKLSDENHTLLSILLGTGVELANQEYISLDSIKKRLNDAKKRYEDKACLIENFNMPLDDMLMQVKSFVLVKQAIQTLLKSHSS
uniref:Uncharacterized protein n=2 Tax=Glossina TaxID=44049 RepID=A0A1A9ZF63_GLOPL